MALTTAQRQAAYRARRATAGESGNGDRRLDMWMSTEADLALARLARRYAMTKRKRPVIPGVWRPTSGYC